MKEERMLLDGSNENILNSLMNLDYFKSATKVHKETITNLLNIFIKEINKAITESSINGKFWAAVNLYSDNDGNRNILASKMVNSIIDKMKKQGYLVERNDLVSDGKHSVKLYIKF